MRSSYEVVIVGGGITGLALAWELDRRGVRDTIVLEKSYSGSGASGRNVGRIRSIQLNERLARLSLAARVKHKALARALGVNTLLWRPGYAWVMYEDDESQRALSYVPTLRSLGARVEVLDASQTLRRLPVLSGGEPPVSSIVGHRDAIVHHDALIYALRRALRHRGVALLEQHEVVDIDVSGGEVRGVTVRGPTGERVMSARAVINAAEGWSRELSASVGLGAPNKRIRHEVLVTEPTKPFMREAITFYRPVEGWFNQTLRGEMVAGASDPGEREGLNQGSTFAFLQRAASVIMSKAPRVGHLHVIRQWAGVYDMTPDRFPIVGPVGAIKGFYQANGYSGRGMALAPLLAEKLAQLIGTGEGHEFLGWCAPDRFVSVGDWEVKSDYYSGYAAETPLQRAGGGLDHE